MESLRKLPVGIQDFEKLREAGCVYVDKTEYVFRLTQESLPYFLGRPRRFGKSLFISTLKAYFLGKKELFEGLAIAEMEKDWITYPVIYIDFNRGNCSDLFSLKRVLNATFKEYESEWGMITDKDEDMSVRFAELINTACKKTGKKVVVLVDEYDKALVSTMDEPQKHEELRLFLKGFYGVLKGMDYCLRFVFLTGVTKFSRVSVFSDLNHLIDISMEECFACICGISEAELLQNFEPELQALADETEKTYDETLAEMKKHYNGYRFSKRGETLYNPFSVLKVFRVKDFGYYWFETGTPTFLVKAVASAHFDIRKFNNDITISSRSIFDYRAGETSIVPLLYQSGYLTIKTYDKKDDTFTLGFPNEEVQYGFLNSLLPAYVPKWGLDLSFSAHEFAKAIRSGVVDDFMTLLQAFIASIPYDLEENKDKDEKYYQMIFYILFTVMGQIVDAEVRIATGRADAVVKTVDAIYVFEFKMEKNGTAESALAQIDTNGYLIPYTADSRRLVKVGVELNIEARGITRWIHKW